MKPTDTIHDNIRTALKKKTVTLLALLGVAVVATLLIHKYFYYLDAYLYTYEFYWLFNVKNLQAANVAHFVDFFRPMGIGTEALPQIILSNLIQNFYLPFSKPILASATTAAFGLGLGSILSLLGFFVVGLLSFGLGSFFLGDILPYLKRDGLEKYRQAMVRPTAIALPLFFAIPLIPIALIAISGAALKVSLRKIIQYMLVGLTMRLCWLLTMPVLFS